MKALSDYENYTYQLRCPLTDTIFYVGEGKGYRAWSHLKPSTIMPYDVNYPSHYGYIKKLHLLAQEPIVELIFEGSKKECLIKEGEMIQQYGLHSEGGSLLQKKQDRKGEKKPWSAQAKERYRELHAQRRQFEFTYEMLYNDYVVNNLSRRQIAEKYQCSQPLIKTRLRDFNIRKR
tara:strand:- start:512 stop:1039 length:528 start_codon:yes stop_codon:yes gene_type:complete